MSPAAEGAEGTGFRVDAAALDAHIRGVDELAGRMAAVARAGRPLDLGAYGLIGRVFAGTAADAAATASAVLRDLGAQSAALVDGVRASTAAYAAAESRNANAFGALR